MPRSLPPSTKLARLVLASGLSASKVAAITGIHYITFLGYCKGRKTPTVAHTASICEMFNLQPKDVLEDQNDRRSHSLS